MTLASSGFDGWNPVTRKSRIAWTISSATTVGIMVGAPGSGTPYPPP